MALFEDIVGSASDSNDDEADGIRIPKKTRAQRPERPVLLDLRSVEEAVLDGDATRLRQITHTAYSHTERLGKVRATAVIWRLGPGSGAGTTGAVCGCHRHPQCGASEGIPEAI